MRPATTTINGETNKNAFSATLYLYIIIHIIFYFMRFFFFSSSAPAAAAAGRPLRENRISIGRPCARRTQRAQWPKSPIRRGCQSSPRPPGQMCARRPCTPRRRGTPKTRGTSTTPGSHYYYYHYDYCRGIMFCNLYNILYFNTRSPFRTRIILSCASACTTHAGITTLRVSRTYLKKKKMFSDRSALWFRRTKL